jgi:transcriptional regulator with XRE-family HTH domain
MLKERLKELRYKERISQRQLSEAIGLERSSIGKYEGNQNIIPSVEVLNAIADYFGVTTDYLLGRSDTYDLSPSPALILAESTGGYPAVFRRPEFEGLTQAEIDKLAIFAEGLKAGRTIKVP